MLYFDYNATTPPADEVLQALAEANSEVWGNPSSLHWAGQKARAMVEKARVKVARLFGASAMDVIFTSGGTEAATQIILGGDALYRPQHLIISAVEHACVMAAADALEVAGWAVTRLPVDGRGLVNPDDLRSSIRADTALVSVMAANNDTGVLQPLRDLAVVARSEAVPFHTDAVQIAGRMAFEPSDTGVDFATISAHKFYGPKGIGAIVCGGRRRPGKLIQGGPQEWGLRSGTENVSAIAGLGVAADLAVKRLAGDPLHLAPLRDRLEEMLAAGLPDIVVHGKGAERLPNTAYIAFPGIRAVALAARLDLEGIAVATTSACASKTEQPPHVLMAMGVPPQLALASVRFSLGEGNTMADVEKVAGRTIALVEEIRRR